MIWVELDESGCVMRAYSGEAIPDESYQQVAGEQSAAEASRMMLEEGLLVPRPELPDFEVGSSVDLPALPLGTKLRVNDLSGDTIMLNMVTETEDWTETLSFPDAGHYEIEIVPPKPLLPVSKRFEV